MPKLKRKKAYASGIVTDFGGIRADADACGSGAVDIRNFCFRSDGTLEKRPGYSLVAEFSGRIRAIWQSAKGSFTGIFLVAGQEILYDEGYGALVSYGQIQNATGPVNFFVYGGYLYLADSSCIYVCDLTGEHFLPVYGYAPLFGLHWNPASGTGEINEPFNLLSPRMRISYDCPAGTRLIRLPFPAASIDSVTANGAALNYSFTAGSRSLTLSAASAETTVTVAFSRTDAYVPLRNTLLTCSLAYGFQDAKGDSLYLAGGEDGFRAFSAARVDSTMLNESKAAYPDSDPLYFKSTGMLILSDQDHPITAFARHNNRVIAFGTSGAWSLQRANEGDTVESYFLDSCPGCVAREGALSVGEELLVLTHSGLCSLRADSSDKDHFSTIPLTRDLSDVLADFDLSSALLCYDLVKNRILLRDASEEGSGLVYLYDRALKRWTCWDGVQASRFFSIRQAILFCKGNRLFRFDDELHLDNGEPYDAYYQSGAISFDSPEEYKRALRVFCELEADDEDLTLDVLTESSDATVTMECSDEAFPVHCECRVPSARFRNFSYRLSFTGSGPAKVYRVGFCCNL